MRPTKKPIVDYVFLEYFYRLYPPTFVYNMLKFIEKRNDVQIKKDKEGKDYVLHGITQREKQILDLFKSGNLNPRSYSTKNEEIERSIKEGLNLLKKTHTNPDVSVGDKIVFLGTNYTFNDWMSDHNTSNQNGKNDEIIQLAHYNEFINTIGEVGEITSIRGNDMFVYFNGVDMEWALDKQTDRYSLKLDEGLNLVKKTANYISPPLSTLKTKYNSGVVDEFFNPQINLNIQNWGAKNLKIKKFINGWALINYNTFLAWRNKTGIFFINNQKYSSSTSKIQYDIKRHVRNMDPHLIHYVDENGVYEAAQRKNDSNFRSYDTHDTSLWEIVSNVVEGLNLPKQKPKSSQEYENELAEELIDNILFVFRAYNHELLETTPGYIKVSLDSSDDSVWYYIRYDGYSFSIETITMNENDEEDLLDYWKYDLPCALSDLKDADNSYPKTDMINNLRNDMKTRAPIQENRKNKIHKILRGI